MADNTQITGGGSGDLIRDKDRAGVKTQIVGLDLAPGGAETLMNGSLPVTAADGAQATIGTTTDLASANTVVGRLKAIANALAGTLTTSVSNFPATQAVTSTDGSQATIGTTTDLSSALTVVGVLKAIKAAVQGTLTVSGTVTANAGSGTLAVSQAASADVATTLTDGRKTVTTAGTPVALAASTACKWVTVSALDANTGLVYVGGSDVLAASGTQKGLPLSAGQSTTIPVANVATVFVDSRVNGEGVSFMVGA